MCLTQKSYGAPEWREALYFTREAIGTHQHIGVYALHTSMLPHLCAPRTPLALQEDLEQLTWLERGARIGVVCLAESHPPGIDTPQELAQARALFR